MTQILRQASQQWFAYDGTIQKTLNVANVAYTGGANGASIKSLMVTNNTTATASVFGFALMDPSAPTVTQTGTTATSTAVTALTDTSQLAVGMGVTGGGVATGTFVTAIGSGTALTLSKATTTTATAALVFTPWPVLNQIAVPAGSGGLAAGGTIPVDLLNPALSQHLPIDQMGKTILNLPSGYKIMVANLTAAAASNGCFNVVAIIEEF